MTEVTDEFDEDYPNNQSLLVMIKAKKGDTRALLAMSDTKDDLEDKDSPQTGFTLIAGSKSDNDSKQEETRVCFSDTKPNLHKYS